MNVRATDRDRADLEQHFVGLDVRNIDFTKLDGVRSQCVLNNGRLSVHTCLGDQSSCHYALIQSVNINDSKRSSDTRDKVRRLWLTLHRFSIRKSLSSNPS